MARVVKDVLYYGREGGSLCQRGVADILSRGSDNKHT